MNDTKPDPLDKRLGLSPAALLFMAPVVMLVFIFVFKWIFKLIEFIFAQ